jgi:receptor expression-enhancing protein 5/6
MADQAKVQFERLTKQIDKFLEDVVFKKIPQAKGVAKKLPPNVKPSYVVLGLVGLICLILMKALGGNALCNLVGFVYPMYRSFKALQTDNKEDDSQWLTYWIVYGFFTTVESVTDLLSGLIPMYYLVKVGFLVWCMAPQTKGAQMIYKKVIEPQLKKGEKHIDEVLKKGEDAVGTGSNIAANMAQAARTHLSTEGEVD